LKIKLVLDERDFNRALSEYANRRGYIVKGGTYIMNPLKIELEVEKREEPGKPEEDKEPLPAREQAEWKF
jgi:hypothetical protein